MSKITDFYAGNATDTSGRRLDQVWVWSDTDLEEVHDYIQWLFPTATRSAYHPNAPVLTDQDMAAFRSDETLRVRLRRSYARFLRFLGLAVTDDGQVIEAENFSERCPEVWTYENHNWLRVSRVLASLRSLGFEEDARALFKWLDAAYHKDIIGAADGHSRSEAAVALAQWTKHAQETV